MPFNVSVTKEPLVVEREQHKSTNVLEARPTLGADRFGQGLETATHPIRCENLRPGEHRQNLGVNPFDLVAAEPHRACWQAGNRIVLELDLDKNGHMAAVCLRPCANLAEGVDEGRGRRPEIDVGHVEYLEARLLKLAAGVGIGTGILAQSDQDFPRGRPGKQSPFGIGEDVELDLTNTLARKLLG